MFKNFLKPQITLFPSFRHGYSLLSATDTAFYQYQFHEFSMTQIFKKLRSGVFIIDFKHIS